MVHKLWRSPWRMGLRDPPTRALPKALIAPFELESRILRAIGDRAVSLPGRPVILFFGGAVFGGVVSLPMSEHPKMDRDEECSLLPAGESALGVFMGLKVDGHLHPQGVEAIHILSRLLILDEGKH